jgi:chromosome partitioning protein
MRVRAIAVINQKGGVGKTTTAVNLAHALVLAGRRVSIMDLDPQGHLTASLGFDERCTPGLDRLLLDNANLSEVRLDVRPGMGLITSGPRLSEFETTVDEANRSPTWLRDALEAECEAQEFVFMDCPPASARLVAQALMAADEVLVPVSANYLGLRGLGYLLETLRRVKSSLRRALTERIVVTLFHSRRRLANEVREKLLEYFPGQVLATPIRETTSLAECPGFGKTIFEYQRWGNGARDYRALAADFLEGRVMS